VTDRATGAIRLLVLDDDRMQLELLERALSRDGFDIRAVETVAELTAEAARFAPELVLVDVNLPGAQPEATIAAARAAARGARIVLYSAWEASRLRALMLQSGADAYLSKSESVLALGPLLRKLAAPGATPDAPR
jgi:DNA-binding response OmpR family regulator